MRLAPWGMMILVLVPLGAASARPQETSVADAARKSREEKKAQPKSAKVWDNDALAQSTSQINVVGQPESPAAATAAEARPAVESQPAPAEKEKTPAEAAEEKTALQADLEAAKSQLGTLKADLGISQRKYTLDQQAFYGRPDYASDTAGAAALQNEKSQVDSQQQQVADAQKKIDELQQKLDALGGAQPKNSQ